MNPESAVRPHAPTGARSLLTDSMQLIADSVTGLVGYRVAALSEPDATGRLRAVAVSGSEAARAALFAQAPAVAELERALSLGEEHEGFWFVPEEQVRAGGLDVTWAPEEDAGTPDDPDRWRRLDLLIAPLRDRHGHLRGILSLDLPVSGRRPGAADWPVLARYARLATRTVVSAFERHRLSAEVHLAETVRDALREAAGELSAAGIVRRIGRTLTAALGLSDLQVLLPGRVPGETDTILVADGTSITPSRALDPAEGDSPVGLPVDLPDGGSALHLELTTVDGTIGTVSLLRPREGPGWSPADLDVARDLADGLGHLFATAYDHHRQQELAARLRAIDADRSRLLATVSHELKNPLSAIVTNLELLEEGGIDGPEADHVRQAIGRGALRMHELTADLRALAVVSGPDGPPASGSSAAGQVDLAAVVEECAELIGPDAARAGLRLHTDVVTDLPSRIPGDRAALLQAVGNLLSNAVKYTEPGGRVSVELTAAPHQVTVQVRDTGIGIAREDLEHIFKEFFRSENVTTRSRPGTGLGLAIAHRVARAHRGRIEVDSAVGLGSTVRLILPRCDAGTGAATGTTASGVTDVG